VLLLLLLLLVLLLLVLAAAAAAAAVLLHLSSIWRLCTADCGDSGVHLPRCMQTVTELAGI
jgi:hypothetical protein